MNVERLLAAMLIPQDKANHVIDGAIYAIVFAAITVLVTPDLGLACATAIGVAILFGAAKEAYDSRHRDLHSVDGFDIFATALGGVAVAVAMWLGSVAKG